MTKVIIPITIEIISISVISAALLFQTLPENNSGMYYVLGRQPPIKQAMLYMIIA